MGRQSSTPPKQKADKRPCKLTDTAIRKAKTAEETYNMSDGGGLYLHIPNTGHGSKFWRINYRLEGKQGTLYLPEYAEMSLAEAREELKECKHNISKGIDPKKARWLRLQGKKAKQLQKQADEETLRLQQQAEEERIKTTFRFVAEDWLENYYAPQVTPKTVSKIRRHLDLYMYPVLGDRPVMELKAVDLIQPAKAKEKEKKIHTAHRLVQLAGQVLDHAIFLGLIEYNLARNNLSKKLVAEKPQHHAAITDPREVGELLCDIEDYRGSAVMRAYLSIMPYLFTRNTELRISKWSEYDLETEMLWTVPAERMKIKDSDHLVPLSRQVVRALKELKALDLSSEYVFPTPRARTRSISDAGPLNAIRLMGYDNETMTIHGFRTTASTALNELGYDENHIEAQLSHAEENEVRDAYNRAKYLEQRRTLMQDWADILDRLRQAARDRRNEKMEKRKMRLQEDSPNNPPQPAIQETTAPQQEIPVYSTPQSEVDVNTPPPVNGSWSSMAPKGNATTKLPSAEGSWASAARRKARGLQ